MPVYLCEASTRLQKVQDKVSKVKIYTGYRSR